MHLIFYQALLKQVITYLLVKGMLLEDGFKACSKVTVVTKLLCVRNFCPFSLKLSQILVSLLLLRHNVVKICFDITFMRLVSYLIFFLRI